MAAAYVKHYRRAIRERNARRKPRYFRDRSNPLEDMDAGHIFERFRFSPETMIYYILGLVNIAEPATKRNMPLPPVLTLLVALRYLARATVDSSNYQFVKLNLFSKSVDGALQIVIGDTINVSRATAGACIRRIVAVLRDLAKRFVVFPSGNRADETKQEFFRIAGFPNVLSLIDGTFIRIIRPRCNEADYVNRKGYHSLNVQMCCDAQFRMTSVNASWPGSVHDSRIFRSSALCEQFENGQHDGILLGDSGYPCRRFLLTPFLNPTSPAEIRYNGALCRTRVLVEQSFGIIKRRFQVLHQTIRSTPEIAINTVIVCVVLHNISIDRGEIINVDHELGIPNEMPARNANIREDGNLMRRHVVETYFS